LIFNWYESSKKDGTGQGLPITKKILRMHNADIECKSTLNKGTEFILTFPKEE
jgi:signal transduction histidine kinase